MTAPIRTLVVDDEPPARRRIRSLLQREADVEVVGECRDGREAIAAVAAECPELVFLDVQMPEVDGFGVVAALPPGAIPAVVFVTAHDEFALRAFEVHALDYLLKPFDRERFTRAMARAREQILLRRRGVADARLLALVEGMAPATPAFARRIAVRDAGRIRFVELDEVEYVAAEGNYVRLVTARGSHLVRDTLAAVAATLDPSVFLRIHRSTVVRIDRIREMEPLFQGEYVLTLQSGAKVRSSRGYRAQLHRALDLPG